MHNTQGHLQQPQYITALSHSNITAEPIVASTKYEMDPMKNGNDSKENKMGGQQKCRLYTPAQSVFTKFHKPKSSVILQPVTY
jgi:hypothetical protein